VRGRIEQIKYLPSDSGYLSKVSLPLGLRTNYKKELVFVEGLSATAEIITEKKRLSIRFFSGLNGLLQ
jgi:hypothetical protein